MLFHVPLLVFAIVFGFALETLAGVRDGFALVGLGILIGVFFASRHIGGSILSALMPVSFAFSTALLLFFVSSPLERRFFIIVSSVVFYIGMLAVYRLRYAPRDTTARSMLSLVSTATLFFSFSAWYGIFLNFENFNELALMLASGGTAFAVSLQTLVRFFVSSFRTALFFSAFLGLFVAEVAWVSTFWPFGSLTTGAATLIFFSPLWEMIVAVATRTFSVGRLVGSLGAAAFLLLMLLSSSTWRLVV